MRIAIAGKGGAGKTTISATFARLAASNGIQVVAVDADANPNLAIALGMSLEDAAALKPIPPAMVSRRLDGAGLTELLDEIIERYALRGPDGIRLFGMGAPGHADEGCLCSAHAVVSAVLEDLGNRPDAVVVVDMEASPEHLSRGTVRHADILCLVAEPYYRSLETVRRMAQLASELPIKKIVVIANKVRSSTDHEALEEFCEQHRLELIGAVPWSDHVVAADRARVSVVDASDTDDFVRAVHSVAETLELLGNVPADL